MGARIGVRAMKVNLESVSQVVSALTTRMTWGQGLG